MTASIVERIVRAIYDAAPYVGSKDEDIPWEKVTEPTKRINEKRAAAALSVICEVLREPDDALVQTIGCIYQYPNVYMGGASEMAKRRGKEILKALASHLDQRTE